jgi:putative sterol carrier protein
MTDPTAEFFDELGRRGHEPLLEKLQGTVRFDLVRGEQTDYWFLEIEGGKICVSLETREADCVVHADHGYFDRVARGETKPLAGLVRNEVQVEGRLQLFLALGRLLPGPPGARHPRQMARDRRRRR